MLCQSGGVLVSHCGGEMITLKINDSVSRERDAWEKLCYINYMTTLQMAVNLSFKL